MANQLSQCEVCVQRFHEAFVYIEDEFDEESSAQLLAILKRLNAERVAKSFRLALEGPDLSKEWDGAQLACAFFE
eukprot:3554163-Pyramimonas_sp.AAC.1